MDPTLDPDLVIGVIFFGAFVVAMALVAVFSALSGPKRKLDQRITGLKERWGTATKPPQAASIRRSSYHQQNTGLDKFFRSLVPRPAELRKRLMQTGLKLTLSQFVITNIVLVVLATALFALVFSFSIFMSLLFGVIIGLGIPHRFLKRLVNRRLMKFTKLFPDAIDLIVRGLRSGLPITESMTTVAQEIEDPVGIEFQRTVDAVKLGQHPDESLAETAERLDTPDFRFFMISLAIQRETGGNLAETLENLSDILRRRAQMKLKIKAMSSEARASAMIIGSLPFIMFGILLLINFDYVSALFTDPRGMMMSGGGLLLMGAGGTVISKMVRFEI